jgi:serine/threonine protein kinase
VPSTPPPNPRDTPIQRLTAPNAETLAKSAPGETDSPTTDQAEFALNPLSLIGKTFGDFELLEEIGRGGMGIVFKARQISLDRIVALKMLLGEHLLNPARCARFLTEARTMAGLDHPSIVRIYQIDQCEFGHFFAMEYVEGRTLESIIKKKHPLPAAWAAKIMAVVADAIQHAHSKGIIHRDLKPANIMIDSRQRPVVMDFGIAKYLGQESGLTQQGTIMGTPAFMAPEQAGEDLVPVGPHSDIYALGAILYMLLTGAPPYDGPTPLSTILKVLEPGPPRAPRELRPDAPVELERIILKSMARRPADRYARAGILADELRRFRTDKKAEEAAAPLPTSLQVVLTVEESGKKIRLRKPVTLVGRAPECALQLRVADVSKHHCRILIEPSRVTVEDLSSANGTFINGQRIEKAPLDDGDDLRIADRVFHVEIVTGEA